MEGEMESYRRLEDLMVYQKLCQLQIAISERTRRWPVEEKYELGAQVRRSSNSAAAQLAEKYDDRHVRNKIEGVNRSRGEAAETVAGNSANGSRPGTVGTQYTPSCQGRTQELCQTGSFLLTTWR